MSKPKVTLLSEEEIERIHYSSLNLLENCGMVIPLKNVLDEMKQYGADVDFDKKICKFPPALVEEFIKKSPNKIEFGARNPRNKKILEQGRSAPLIIPNLDATYTTDLETRDRRPGLLRDVEEFNKVIDALDHIAFGSGEVIIPSDVAPHMAQYCSWIAAFKNTSKHMLLYQSGSQVTKVAIEMASAILGDKRKLKDNLIVSFWACIPEVLGFEEALLDGMVETARAGLPLLIEAGPASGATGPGTLAGTLLLGNAELLGAITITQIFNPGTPVGYSNYARHFDMRAENVSLASPEFALLRICQGQLAGYYNIPSAASGMTADSKILDLQAGYDKAVSLISILSGNDIIISDAMDQGDVGDIAELVVMEELAAGYLRVWEGLKIDEHSLAMEEIKRVGPGLGHNFLGSKFTLENFRKETWLDYKIAERRKWNIWKKEGGKSAETRAMEQAKEILRNHNPDPLPEDVEKQLKSIITSAHKP